MNCVEFRQHLEDTIDARRSLDSVDLTVHVAACPECRAAWDDQHALNAAITVWKPVTRQVDFTDRVLAALRQAQAATEQTPAIQAAPATEFSSVPRSARSSFAPLVVTVALVLVAVTMVLSEKPADKTVAKSVPVQPVVSSNDGVADLSDLISDAKSAWIGLAQSTVQRTQDLKVFVPDLPAGGDEPAVSPKDPGSKDEEIELAPVPGEFRRAFEFLFKAAGAEDATT